MLVTPVATALTPLFAALIQLATAVGLAAGSVAVALTAGVIVPVGYAASELAKPMAKAAEVEAGLEGVSNTGLS